MLCDVQNGWTARSYMHCNDNPNADEAHIVQTVQLLGKAYVDLALYHDHEASCTNRDMGGGEQGSSGVQQHCVALLPGSSKAPGSRRAQQRPPLTRSSHVSMQGEVLVEWWWADEPILLPSGVLILPVGCALQAVVLPMRSAVLIAA